MAVYDDLKLASLAFTYSISLIGNLGEEKAFCGFGFLDPLLSLWGNRNSHDGLFDTVQKRVTVPYIAITQ